MNTFVETDLDAAHPVDIIIAMFWLAKRDDRSESGYSFSPALDAALLKFEINP